MTQKNEVQTPRLFLTKTFWLLFTIAVIISLYLIGTKKIEDKTEIAQTKKALQTAEQKLSACTNDNNSKANEINQLNRTISAQADTITQEETSKANEINQLNGTISAQANTIAQKETAINKLQNTIAELKNQPPKILIKNQERIVYKDKPEPYHRFGKNNGRLLVYTTCTSGYIRVWFDGNYVGELTGHYSSSPDCNSTDHTLNKILVAGRHQIKAVNTSTRATWNFYVTLSEDDCQIQALTCKQRNIRQNYGQRPY